MSGLGTGALILLAVFGLAAGIGITAVGPGGVLATIGLFTLTNLSPEGVAGTAIVTHVATGLVGTAAYVHSGQLRQPITRRAAVLLASAAVIGTPIGVVINANISGRTFGILLGLFVAGVAVMVLHRQRRHAEPPPHHQPRHPTVLLVAIGVGVATASGMFGLGGPMLTVPILVAIGFPVLPALAAAQAQSVVIASVGTLGYLSRGAIDWPLAALVGIPELAGVLIGWRIARAVPARALKHALITALLLLAPYLALHS